MDEYVKISVERYNELLATKELFENKDFKYKFYGSVKNLIKLYDNCSYVVKFQTDEEIGAAFEKREEGLQFQIKELNERIQKQSELINLKNDDLRELNHKIRQITIQTENLERNNKRLNKNDDWKNLSDNIKKLNVYG